jgi:two-component system chemotaxis response regulator CheB
MFSSLVQCAGRNVIAAILTCMGRDGAQGMLEIRQAGGYTVAQDEATCVI